MRTFNRKKGVANSVETIREDTIAPMENTLREMTVVPEHFVESDRSYSLEESNQVMAAAVPESNVNHGDTYYVASVPESHFNRRDIPGFVYPY